MNKYQWRWRVLTQSQEYIIDSTGYGYGPLVQAELVARHGCWIKPNVFLAPAAIHSVEVIDG